MSVGPRDLHTLHRYFLWADRMRFHFYAVLPPQGSSAEANAEAMFTHPYMAYWYAAMYVLIEGWRELELADSVIDTLLESPLVDTLKRFRNGAFHFQRDYFDDRFLGFIGGKESARWIYDLNAAFSRWFFDYFAWRKAGEVDEPGEVQGPQPSP